MLGHLTLSQSYLSLSSFLLILFSFFLSASFLSTVISSTSLILSSASIILLLIPSRVFLIWVIAWFIIDWIFFISSRSLLNISCIFSILVFSLSVILFCFLDFESSSLSLFWIIFQVNYLSPPLVGSLVGFGLVGFYLYNVPSPAEYFTAFSFC